MASAKLSRFLRSIARGMAAEALRDQCDRELVARFLAGQEEAVFEVFVRRHGPMVYRVCWRVLQHSQDAEDAFQATFLLLAQKLRTVRNRDSLASWLHGVAHRVALKAKAQVATRRQHEQQASIYQAVPPDDVMWRELRLVLDAELAQLPEKWRLPLVLCYLEGRTQDEAAGQLGWSKSTLVRRLDDARTALGRRLTRKGVVWPAALSAVLLSDCVGSATLPSGLIGSTGEAAACVAAGKTAAAGLISAKAAALTRGIMKAMLFTQLKIAMVALLSVGFVVAGVTALSTPGLEPRQRTAPFVGTPEKPKSKAKAKPRLQAEAKAHEDTVMCAVVAPDGKTVVTGGADNRISVLELATGKVLATLKGHEGPIRSVIFFPDGKTFASASEDHTVRLWDIHACKEIGSLPVGRRVYNLAISPDGSKLATATGDWTRQDGIERPGQVYIWDVATRKQEMTLPDHDPTVWSVAFSPDGKLLGSVQDRENVQLWDLTAGKVIDVLKHPTQIRPIAFSPDGKTLATGLRSGEVRLWDVGASIQMRQDVRAHEAQIFSLRFSPDGKRLATASEDETAKLWNVDGPAITEAATLKGHQGQVWFAVFSPDGKTLITGGKDQTVRIWDVSPVASK